MLCFLDCRWQRLMWFIPTTLKRGAPGIDPDPRPCAIQKVGKISNVIERNLRSGQAAEILGITPRHCSRLINRFRESGAVGLAYLRRGRPGNHRLPE
ncbi:helix-turn-helix domain-containing protein [Klebsiella pneumoniae]|uniref:helix-turn-helix domain-containing protein n=2 Tax=Klebsiella TaxID=570 RepID=UPI002867BFD1|nr:helix-turn-helix domain-containing protein [Klebsiella pneumoniae]